MDGISKFSRFVRLQDPAVEAWKKVTDAGEDDVAYELAIVEFENSAPINPRGVSLKMKLEWERLRSLLQGDRLTPSGRHRMRAFRKTINEAVAYLAKQGRHAGYRW